MSRKREIHRYLSQKLSVLDDKLCDISSDRVTDPLFAATDRLQQVLCFLFGHVPVSDQCNRPEHDYCVWCNASQPGLAEDRVPK